MNAKKYFKLDEKSRVFNSMNEKEKILVKEGHELVKTFIADRAKADSNKGFVDALEGITRPHEANRSEKFMEKLVKYSLESAGETFGNDFDLSCIKNPMLNTRRAFQEKFNSIIAQIITPVIPAMISTTYMDMADVVNIAWGETARWRVKSNDTFYVSRYAEGILDGSVQRLYNAEVVVNPEPYGIKTTVDWYQVASGIFDIGEFTYKIGVSFSNYITLMVVNAITKFVQAGFPAAYFTTGFTTTKWAKLAELVSAANGGNANVKAYGTLAALMSILPGTGASTVVANLQMGLGKEWTSMGYLGKYMGVDTIRIPQILLPNTVNSAPLFGLPDDIVYFFADGGYKSVKLALEGNTLVINIIPTDSPDKEMGVDMQMRMGMGFVNASKFGAITGIVPPTGV